MSHGHRSKQQTSLRCSCALSRAKAKCLTDDLGLPIRQAVHTFFLERQDGSDVCPQVVAEFLSASGGVKVKHLTEDRVPPRMVALHDNNFAFNVSELSSNTGLQESFAQDDVPDVHGRTFAVHQDRFAMIL